MKGDLNTSSSDLRNAWKVLRLRWDELNTGWNDAASQNFAEHHLLPLEEAVTEAIKDIDKLAQVITRAKHDCS
jgi:hypothetical protein